MIKLYIRYWRNIFNYKEKTNTKEVLTVVLFNFLILFLILCIGVLVPISWENRVVDLWYVVIGIMIIPTVSLVVRMIQTINRK